MKTEMPLTEPSMDEILTSIRQIISDHAQDETKPSLVSQAPEDILDLTNALEEEGSDREIKNPPREIPAEPLLEELLVSSTTMIESAQALHSLNRHFAQEPLFAEGMGGQTVEMLVRETLKPLLKEWLDANLAALVRSIVKEQVEKIVRQGRSAV